MMNLRKSEKYFKILLIQWFLNSNIIANNI